MQKCSPLYAAKCFKMTVKEKKAQPAFTEPGSDSDNRQHTVKSRKVTTDR